MKVGASIRKKCKNCRIVKRRKGANKKTVRYVICENPKHKQRQG